MLKFGRTILVLYNLLTIYGVHSYSKGPANFFNKIVTRNNNKPIVVHVDAVNKQADVLNLFLNHNKGYYGITNDLNDLLTEPSDDEAFEYDGETLEDIAKNKAKDLINIFLRTSPDKDPEIEDKKQILRQALRARCKTVTTCISKCKTKKPSCPQNCQKIYDDLDLCDTKVDKCRKAKCGRTMPPKWLL